MLVSVLHDQAGLALLQSQWIVNFSCVEEVMKREPICSFLPLSTEFFATSHSTLTFSGNFGTPLPAGNIIIYDASSSVSVIKEFHRLLC
jgi:hypothetical protein